MLPLTLKYLPLVLEHSYTLNVLQSRVHGLDHWLAVARNGAWLCERVPKADPVVVELFALFHDADRRNEWVDRDHGKRGWLLACWLGLPLELTGPQVWALRIACVSHDRGYVHDHPTIGVCWDADRLDLPRVGTRPRPELLSTEPARLRIRPRRPAMVAPRLITPSGMGVLQRLERGRGPGNGQGNALKKLENDGYIRRQPPCGRKPGRWTLTRAGIDALRSVR